jgi:hypothetical protein
MKGFGPRLSETDTISSGKCASAPERHFVPEVRLKTDKRTAGRFCCNKHNPIAMGCRTDLVSKYATDQNNSNLTP